MDKILKALEKAQKERKENIKPDFASEPAKNEKNEEAIKDHQPDLKVISSQHETVPAFNASADKGQATGQRKGSLHKDDSTRALTDKKTIDPKLIVYHEPESIAAEHFKLLRSRILHPLDDRKIRVVLVTSAMEGAGKTTVACNLALSIAQSVDPYALLIDADVRRSSIHKMFGLAPPKGLTDYLHGRAQLPECLLKTTISKLTILPAGNPVPNPAEIITSAKMKKLIKEAEARYSDRFIIIDSPPINLASEAVDLAKLVDTILLVVRCGGSNKSMIDQALEKLDREKIMGVVFNAYERPSGKYGYYRKGYGYYG